MKDKNYITLFMDEELEPMGTFAIPAVFELDTRLLGQGNHFIKLVDTKAKRKKKVKIVPFTVEQNPTAVIFVGTKKKQIVNEIIPLKSHPNVQITEDDKASVRNKIKLMIASFFGAAGLSQF